MHFPFKTKIEVYIVKDGDVSPVHIFPHLSMWTTLSKLSMVIISVFDGLCISRGQIARILICVLFCTTALTSFDLSDPGQSWSALFRSDHY